MIVGTVKRAPAVVRNNHLEWAWRLVKSPKRIIRIVNAVLIFPTHVLKDALISRVKYRKNVLAFIFRNKESILIIHKTYYDGHTGRCWAFPQGGVDDGETEEEALLREVKEEVGLHKQIKIVGMSLFKHRYKFSQFHRNVYGYKYAGQYQRAYYIKLVGEEKVHLEDDGGVHIDSYRFVTQEELLKLIKPPRRENALKLLNEFNQKRIYDRKTS
jgi:putative (di)nucleoside polyphosphate hydrolase